MKFAVKDDFLEITQLFQKNIKLFPHVRMSYINSRIERNECIFSDGVVIIYQIHQISVKIGNMTKSQKSDCHINQIFTTIHDGRASRILNQFFNYISLLPHASGVIYLNVKSENERAKKFYQRNGMKLIEKISWSEGRIEGDVFQMMVKKNDGQNLDSSFPRFDPSKYV